MKKHIKYGLLGLGMILVLGAGTIGYLMLTFNPNAYKPQIIRAVQEKQQRTLKLGGDIQLTFFPGIGAQVANISLSERNSKDEFASVENALVSLALLPLLAKQVIVNEVALSGVRVRVVKFKDGSSNLDDFAGKQENEAAGSAETESRQATPVKFDIASVKIENTELGYQDQRTGAQYTLKNLNLETGRLANGVAGKIKFDAEIQASKPKLDITTQIQTTLTFDLAKQFYQLENLDLQAKGSALVFGQLQLNATGEASINLATQEYKTRKLEVSADGMKDKDTFSARLKMPEFDFTRDKVVAKNLLINANMDGEAGKLIAMLVVENMEGGVNNFKSGKVMLNVDLIRPEQAFKLKISSPVSGSIDARKLDFPGLVIAVNATGDKLPVKSLSSEMKGSVQIDGVRESVRLNLAGGLLQSQVKASMSLMGFDKPAIRFDVDADQFDADVYLPKKTTSPSGKAASVPSPEQPFDLSALQKLTLDGSLRMGALKVANIKSTGLSMKVKADKGVVNISPLSASLYQGSLYGSVLVNATQAAPTFTVKQNLSGVQLGPLVRDAADFDMVEGKGNLALNLVTQGNLVSAIKKNLNGTAALKMDQGAIKGINLSKLVRAAQNIGQSGAVETLKPVSGDKTDFSELKASFNINKGVAHNDDLLVKSQSLKMTGQGDVDIGNSRIHYATKTTLADSVDGKSASITVPVEILGTFDDLKFRVDYAAILADIARQKVNAKVEEKREELKQQLQEKLKGGLRDLFKQ